MPKFTYPKKENKTKGQQRQTSRFQNGDEILGKSEEAMYIDKSSDAYLTNGASHELNPL